MNGLETDPVFDGLLLAIFFAAPLVTLVLLFLRAPYGRYRREGWGPNLNSRIAWVVMEAPAALAFAWFFYAGSNAGAVVPLILFALWEIHYLDRAFFYPLRIQIRRGGGMPLGIVAMGFAFNVANSFTNARWIAEYGTYGIAWLRSPEFIIGLLLFAAGFLINRHSDRILMRLRSNPGEDYGIPRGGGFELVSAPNYLGELIMWGGFALSSWSPAALAFFIFSVANLAPRALSHHAWYRRRFPDYPRQRKAIIPFILIV